MKPVRIRLLSTVTLSVLAACAGPRRTPTQVASPPAPADPAPATAAEPAQPEVIRNDVTLAALSGPFPDLPAFCEARGLDEEFLEPPGCAGPRSEALKSDALAGQVTEARTFELENHAMGAQVVLGLRTQRGWYFTVLTMDTHELAKVTSAALLETSIGSILIFDVYYNHDRNALNRIWEGKLFCVVDNGEPACTSPLYHDYRELDFSTGSEEPEEASVKYTLDLDPRARIVVVYREGDRELGDDTLIPEGIHQLVLEPGDEPEDEP